jgi:hypothetical protein
MDEKLAKASTWAQAFAADIEGGCAKAEWARSTPAMHQRLLDFMVDGCGFSRGHADGTSAPVACCPMR